MANEVRYDIRETDGAFALYRITAIEGEEPIEDLLGSRGSEAEARLLIKEDITSTRWLSRLPNADNPSA